MGLVETRGFLRDEDTDALVVHESPSSTDGWTPASFLDVDETEDEVKAAPGVLNGYSIHNRSASEIFVKFFDGLARDVEVGTTTDPAWVVPLQPRTAANVSGLRLEFSTGICIAAVTGVRDDSRTGPSDNEVVANVSYA